MPRMTDYVRKGYRRRQRPWDRAELPEWWDTAVWMIGGGIVVLLVLSALFGGDEPTGDPAADDGAARSYAVQTLGSNPTTGPGAVPSAGATGSTAPTAPATPQPETLSKDFEASAAVQVPVTGGGMTVVPAGARNVALAAARATATGDWSGIPFVGPARPNSSGARAGQGAAPGPLTVADPSRNGNSQYRFSATVKRPGAAQASIVEFLVERDADGYAIRFG